MQETSTPTFEWDMVSNAAGYVLRVNQGTQFLFFQKILPEACDAGFCSWTPEEPLAPGDHWAWVRADHEINEGIWSTWVSFSIREPCEGQGFNACGGCDLLAGEPGFGCGQCSTAGYWECDGLNNVVCVNGDANACGGCTPLPDLPGQPCGICLSGTWECNGSETIECAGVTTTEEECPVKVQIVEPLWDGTAVTPGDFWFRVKTEGSDYEIQSATAQMATHQYPMDFNYPPGEARWDAYLDASHQPSGMQVLAATVTDILGNQSQTVRYVDFDRLPQLVWNLPETGIVAQETVHVQAECLDDKPDCKIEITGYWDEGSDTHSFYLVNFFDDPPIDEFFDVSTEIPSRPTSESVRLYARVKDSAGRIPWPATQRDILYVSFLPADVPVEIVHTVPGARILDFDENRILYRLANEFFVQTQDTEEILLDNLFAKGVHHDWEKPLEGSGCDSYVHLSSTGMVGWDWEWYNGTLIPRPYGNWKINGQYGACFDAKYEEVVHYRDFAGDTFFLLGQDDTMGSGVNVFPNGDVFFVHSNEETGPVGEYYDATTQEMWSFATGGPISGTDGNLFVYSKESSPGANDYAAFMHDRTTETQLNDHVVGQRTEVQIVNGWIAFRTLSLTSGKHFVSLRNPQGDISRVSFFSGNTYVDAMGDDSSLIMSVYEGTPYSYRYFHRAPDGTETELGQISRGWRWMDGAFYYARGNVLYKLVP